MGIFSRLVPWPLNSRPPRSRTSSCRPAAVMETWQRGRRTVGSYSGLTVQAVLVYTEPIIIAAVARPSNDIKRLLNQQPIRLSVMHCQTKCPHHTALLPLEHHIISFAMRRTTDCKSGVLRFRLKCLFLTWRTGRQDGVWCHKKRWSNWSIDKHQAANNE